MLSLCDDLLTRVRSAETKEGVAAVASRLREPLRVAVAGRTGIGKSTLVNSLIGVPVAPTAAGECTRVVTWYRFGDHDQATAVLRDGSRLPIALEQDRMLPEALPVPWEDVDFLDVRLYCSPLRELTLIDTPGLSSLSEDGAARTAQVLTMSSRNAARAADALVYVISRTVREDDQQVIEAFGEEARLLRASAANCVVVLNKADKLVEAGEDPAEVCGRLVVRARQDLGPAVAEVVPLIGLLAETSACGRLNETVARAIREMADSFADAPGIDGRSLRRAVADIVRANAEESKRAVRLLDIYGLQNCLRAAAAGRAGAGELTRICEELSGVAHLRSILFDRFALRANLLKVDSALNGLRTLISSASQPDQQMLTEALRDGAESLKLAPEGSALRVMALLRQATSGRVQLPLELNDEIARWVSEAELARRVGLDAEAPWEIVRSTALGLASRWRAYGNDPRRDAAQREAAQVMSAAYALEVQAAGS